MSKERSLDLRAQPDGVDFGGLEDEGIDLRQYWYIFRKYQWVIFGLAVLVAVLAGLLVFTMRPVYRSTATLLVEGPINRMLSLEEIYRGDTQKGEYFATQIEILKSRDLARQVVEKLKLGESPEFVGRKDDKPKLPWRQWLIDWLPALKSTVAAGDTKPVFLPDPQEGLIATFKSRLTALPRKGTQLVDISFEANDPKFAEKVLNSLCDVFIENNSQTRVSATRQGSEWLGERLQGLREKVADSEKQLQDYYEKEHLVDLEGVMTLTSKEVDSNSARLADARSRRTALENLLSKIRSTGDDLYKNIEIVPEIYQDSSVQSLKAKQMELIAKIADLGQRYGVDYPSMVSARSELESVTSLLHKQINTVVNGIKSRLDVAKADEQSAANSLEANKAQVQAIGRKQGKVRELQQQIESNKKLYDTFFDRYKETSEAAGVKSQNIRFVDRASYSATPVRPKKGLIVGISFGVSLFIGILLAFLLERLDSTLKTPDDVEAKLGKGTQVFGIIPFYKLSKGKWVQSEVDTVGRMVLDQPKSGFSEAVRTVRTGLVLSALDNPHNTWLITSSLPAEGKTTIATNIGFAMAQMESGRVLLIDADLRRASLGKRLGFAPRSLGLTHCLAREAELDACIHPIPGSTLSFMPAGLIPPNPLEMLSSQGFSKLWEELQARFSVILIDSPPVHSVSDAFFLTQYANSVVYVVHTDKTPIAIVKEGIKRLQHFGDTKLGIVLNMVDFDNPSRYGGYYSNYYYSYYYSKKAYGDEGSSKIITKA